MREYKIETSRFACAHVSGGPEALVPRRAATALPAAEGGEADALHVFTSAARLLTMETATS